MSAWDTTLPPLLRDLHKLEFDYADRDGIDFEPYGAFSPKDETMEWFRAWTGNVAADGSSFRIFGQDGTGGYAAFWLVEESRGLLKQPIVFLGSEGETGLVSIDFERYLWLLAGGIGPYEAVAYPCESFTTNKQFREFAELHAISDEATPAEVIAEARAAYPNFSEWVGSLCR